MLGAAVITVEVLVTEVGEPPELASQSDLRRRVGRILKHQFYILFAPLGAIFVYVGLAAAGAEQHTLTVGLAAFGAGLTLNLVLKRALSLAGRTLGPSSTEE